MSPREHGVHIAFLGAFFDCLGVPSATGDDLVNRTVTANREVRTDGGNWIDITVQGEDWLLVIENKVYHWVANPLEDYEAHAATLAGDQKLFLAILSPSGSSPHPEIWKPITYRAFVRNLKVRLEQPSIKDNTSKWLFLANEFILHLEQEICQSHMNEEEIRFVETNARGIETLKALSQQYLDLVASDVRKALERSCIADFLFSWQGWGLWARSKSQCEKWQLGLVTPYQRRDGKTEFDVIIWLGLTRPSANKIVAKHAPCFKQTGQDEGLWEFTGQFTQRDEAIEELHRLVSVFVEELNPPVLNLSER